MSLAYIADKNLANVRRLAMSVVQLTDTGLVPAPVKQEALDDGPCAGQLVRAHGPRVLAEETHASPPPKMATYKELAAYHTREYLDYVLDPKNSNTAAVPELGLEDDCPPFPGLSVYVPLIAGATLTAVEALRNGAERAVCWDGGRHHAQKSRAAGFCYVADCVLGMLALKRPMSGIPKPKVMYLDLDLHFSDAVSEAFCGGSGQTLHPPHLPRLLPPSPHASLPTPTSDPYTLSIPLKHGASNATYARIWPLVEHVKNAFSPDFIVLQCGTDALAGDPCATFNWALGGEGGMGWCVQRVLAWGKGVLMLGGGGYESCNAARAWCYLTSLALDNPLDLESHIPDHSGFPLYKPSFTLDVPSGNMRDENDEEYLEEVERCYNGVVEVLRGG